MFPQNKQTSPPVYSASVSRTVYCFKRNNPLETLHVLSIKVDNLLALEMLRKDNRTYFIVLDLTQWRMRHVIPALMVGLFVSLAIRSPYTRIYATLP